MGGGGRGGGGKIAIGGGAGLVVVIIALLFGLNPGDLLGTSADPDTDPSAGSSRFEQCKTGSDIQNNRDCRFVAYTNSIQSYWKSALQGYRTIQVHTFSDSVA